MKTCVFMITNQCNLTCRYCYAEAFHGAPSGGADRVPDVVPEVLDALLSYKPSRVVIGGGEPLMRSDLFELLTEAGRVARVQLLTNGTLLTRETAEKIRACGVELVGISLDSAEAEPHDHLRSASHHAVLRGIDCCLAAGLPVDLMVTVSTLNASSVRGVIAFARRMGIERVTFSDLIPQGRAGERADLVLSAEQTETLLENLAQDREVEGRPRVDVYIPQWVRWDRGGPGCEAGRSLFALRPDGTILPCTQVPVPLGNILLDDLHDVWNGKAMDNLRRVRRGPCADCGWRGACGGCRGKALAAGDLFGSDPSCLLAWNTRSHPWAEPSQAAAPEGFLYGRRMSDRHGNPKAHRPRAEQSRKPARRAMP